MKKINNVLFDKDHFEEHDGIWLSDDGILCVEGYIDEDGTVHLTKKVYKDDTDR